MKVKQFQSCQWSKTENIKSKEKCSIKRLNGIIFFFTHPWTCFVIMATVNHFPFHTSDIRGSISEKQTSFHTQQPACCSSPPFSGCMHGGILRLLSPQGTSSNSFSVNFHPLPNSDEPFLPPTPQWRICPRSLCPPLISFFFWTAPSLQTACSVCKYALFYSPDPSPEWKLP